MAGRTHEPVDNLSRPEFRRWITDAEVVASIFGLLILGMAAMGAVGVSWKNVEVTVVRVVD